MRILHVVPSYVPAWRYGGPIVAVHGLCRALVALGHSVSVYTTTADGDGELDVAAERPTDVDGVQVTYFRCDGPRRLYWASGMRRALLRSVRDFDVLHTHSCFLMPPTWAARTARKFGVPYVFSPRGMLVPELITARSTWAKRIWIMCFDAPNARHAAAVHVTSDRERADLNRVMPTVRHQVVIANGVDYPATAPDRPSVDGHLNMLCLGRVNWKKGIDLALRVLASVPQTRLRVVGNDEEQLLPRLQALAKGLGVEDRVDWRGPRYAAERDAELEWAHVLLVPSLSENFGNVVIEAMATGLPVICTQQVGAAWLVAETGAGVVVERSVAAIANAVARLAASPETLILMGRAGRAAAAQYGWLARASDFVELYESVQPERGAQDLRGAGMATRGTDTDARAGGPSGQGVQTR